MFPVLVLRWLDPPTTSFVLQYQFAQWLEGKAASVAQPWVSLERMGALIHAVVASEDQKFPDHFGFDLASIEGALQAHERGQRLRGASTITQQTAKNLFLWSGRSFLRKGIEAYFTLLLELCWSKARILEVYLNVAEFGPGLYGAGTAARYYFGKSTTRLSDREAARLVVVLPNPKRIDPRAHSDYVERRSRWVLEEMARLRGEGALTGLTQ